MNTAQLDRLISVLERISESLQGIEESLTPVETSGYAHEVSDIPWYDEHGNKTITTFTTL